MTQTKAKVKMLHQVRIDSRKQVFITAYKSQADYILSQHAQRLGVELLIVDGKYSEKLQEGIKAASKVLIVGPTTANSVRKAENLCKTYKKTYLRVNSSDELASDVEFLNAPAHALYIACQPMKLTNEEVGPRKLLLEWCLTTLLRFAK